MKFRCRLMAAILLAGLLVSSHGTARGEARPTPSFTGPLGLNTMPSARMDPAGTVRMTGSSGLSYLHGELGLQMADPLYIGLRQTAQSTDLWGKADRLCPGVDIKLRLAGESAHRPAIVLGLQSAFGHKRTAAEYLVLSKRHENLDFTGGIGWGRFGSASHASNPLAVISRHFDGHRGHDGETSNGPHEWFTGDIGFFGGVEYFPAWLKNVSFKTEWSADRYLAERTQANFNTPAPWSVGMNYMPFSWLDMGVALSGDRMLGSLSLHGPLKAWPLRAASRHEPVAVLPYRAGQVVPGDMVRGARSENILLHDAGHDGPTAWAMLETREEEPLPWQIGRAARHMANHGGLDTEELAVVPTRYGLRGPSVRLLRHDVERALAFDQGSPQEIWRHAEIKPDHIAEGDPATEEPGNRLPGHLSFILDTQLSLSEKDDSIFYRTGLVAAHRLPLSTHWMTGTDFRLNIADNLDGLNRYRPVALLPTRGDVDRFAGRRVGLDRMFLGYTRSFGGNLHAAAALGYLEEMYSGLGGEILYRPFGKTYAFGVDAWEALKRDPGTGLNLGMNGDHLLTGHFNVWYEIPDTDLTLQARFGRYLAEDIGTTLSLENRFRNGMRLKAMATATDMGDFDAFGGTSHLYGGLQLSIPLGSPRYIPDGTSARVTASPMGRNAGQSIDSPLPLYDMTEPFSLRSIAREWPAIVE